MRCPQLSGCGNIIKPETRQWLMEHVPILSDMGPWKTTVSRTLVVASFHIASLYIMSVMVVVGGTRYPKYKAALPDLGFDVLAPYPELSWLPNTMIYILLFATLVRCVFSRQGLTIVRRVLFVHAITMLMRSLTLVATSYPDPSAPCVDYMPPQNVNPFWAKTVGNADLITCGDLMFSGHTLIYVVLALAWQKYFYVVEKVIFWMFTLVAILMLSVARLHYLNDIIVAVYVISATWHIYHLYAADIARAPRRNPIVAWLETDINRRLARERRRARVAAVAAEKKRRIARRAADHGASTVTGTDNENDSDPDDRAVTPMSEPSTGSFDRITRFFQSGQNAAAAAAQQLRHTRDTIRRSSSIQSNGNGSKHKRRNDHRRQPSGELSWREDDIDEPDADADDDIVPLVPLVDTRATNAAARSVAAAVGAAPPVTSSTAAASSSSTTSRPNVVPAIRLEVPDDEL